jgi:hypothetical protein
MAGVAASAKRGFVVWNGRRSPSLSCSFFNPVNCNAENDLMLCGLLTKAARALKFLDTMGTNRWAMVMREISFQLL